MVSALNAIRPRYSALFGDFPSSTRRGGPACFSRLMACSFERGSVQGFLFESAGAHSGGKGELMAADAENPSVIADVDCIEVCILLLVGVISAVFFFSVDMCVLRKLRIHRRNG